MTRIDQIRKNQMYSHKREQSVLLSAVSPLALNAQFHSCVHPQLFSLHSNFSQNTENITDTSY